MNPLDILLEFLFLSPTQPAHIRFLIQLLYVSSYSFLLFISLEGLKTFPLLVFFAMHSMELWLDNVNLLVKMFELKSADMRERVYLIYRQFQVINTHAKEFAAPVVLVLLHFFSTTNSVFLYLIIRTHSLFPVELYFVICVAEVLFFTAFVVELSTTSGLFESSNDAITSWNLELYDGKSKRLKRQYESLRPLAFFCGLNGFIFYPLDQSTFANFMVAVQDKTVDWLVTVPLSALSKMLDF